MAVFKATVTMRDSNGYITRKTFETETDVLLTAQAAVAGLLTDLNAVTDLAVDKVTYSLSDTTGAFAGELASNVDLGATFVGKVASGELVTIKVPGFPQSLVGANGAIALGGAEVAAFLDNFEATGSFTISDGETVAEWVKGTRDR